MSLYSLRSDDLDSEFASDGDDDALSVPATPRSASKARSGRATPADADADADDFVQSSVASFDAYFTFVSQPSRTSSSVFSHIIAPLSADEFADALSPVSRKYTPPLSTPPAALSAQHRRDIPRFLRELDEGFRLAFYGFGSKRAALNALARAAARRGHVLVVNAFQPSFAPKDVLSALPPPPRPENALATTRPVYVVIHNYDAPALRSPKARALLAALHTRADVRLAVSVDHLNAPLLWAGAELAAGRWLWHDLTTLAPYAVELAFSDPASLRAMPTSASAARGPSAGAPGGAQMTETAAQHVLLSVTQKAQKLFALLARHQLGALEAAEAETAAAAELAIAYDMLFTLARDNFVATNDTALRALLGEFRDHGLVVTAGMGTLGASETLWVPLRKERLKRLLEWLEAQAQG
ncbi:origin recognition complex subunit 2 [Auriscalpium vulgare]|uniref:Origin recognition complex subunit 2 n=1 Tax=Auriscalpium vulgare TaxID=40419 RepID=A0ACB8S4P8_9AGAM|nr:origin recognition complex subunit 2 [Auriscalpium vulgare]